MVDVTTHTVLHNLIFGCLLVFLIQWIFLGDLRSAIIVGVNIPFALFFAIIMLVLQGQDANLLSIGAVDFGIIVDSAVILVENIFRNFQSMPSVQQQMVEALRQGTYGRDPTHLGQRVPPGPTGCGLIYVSRPAGRQGDAVLDRHHRRRVRPLFTMQGVEGQIFGPMARTYGYALVGRADRDLHRHPGAVLVPAAAAMSRNPRRSIVRALHRVYTAGARFGARAARDSWSASAARSLRWSGLLAPLLGSEFLPALEEGNYWIRAVDASDHVAWRRARRRPRKMREILLRHPEIITVVSQHGRPDNGSDASPFSNVELFAPLKPYDEWPRRHDQGQVDAQLQKEFNAALPGVGVQFLAVHPGQRRGGAVGRQRRQLGQDHRAQPAMTSRN